jgi:hypothetical protein
MSFVPQPAGPAQHAVLEDIATDPAPTEAPATSVTSARREPAEIVGIFGLVDALLRDHRRILDRIAADDRLTELARGLVVIILCCAALFGAAMGFYRGGIQMLFAAIKLPLAVLLTAALSVPAFMAMNAAAEGKAHPRQDATLVLLSLAGACLLISATAPIIVLAAFWEYAYHSTILLVVACCGVGGLYGLRIFVRGVQQRKTPARVLIGLALAMVFGAVGSQMSWTLRPFLVRPRTVQVPFIRGIEGSFMESVRMSTDSARGRYIREAAPLPEAAEAIEPAPMSLPDAPVSPPELR